MNLKQLLATRECRAFIAIEFGRERFPDFLLRHAIHGHPNALGEEKVVDLLVLEGQDALSRRAMLESLTIASIESAASPAGLRNAFLATLIAPMTLGSFSEMRHRSDGSADHDEETRNVDVRAEGTAKQNRRR